MDFEKKIKESLQTQRIDLDSEMFLESLHKKRKAIEFRRNRIINAFSAMALLFFVGFSTFKSLKNENYSYALNDLKAIQNMDQETELFMHDLANYLIDSSDNYWETIEFFEELEYEPIYSLNIIGENQNEEVVRDIVGTPIGGFRELSGCRNLSLDSNLFLHYLSKERLPKRRKQQEHKKRGFAMKKCVGDASSNREQSHVDFQ